MSIKQKVYEKDLARYKREKSENQKRAMDFNARQWSSCSEKLQAQYYLTKAKIQLEENERKLAATKIRLENESTRLGNLCKTKEAQEKIALLAADILRKNLETYEAFDEPKMPPSSSLNGTFGNPRGLPPRTVAIFSFHDIILAST